MKAKWPGCVGLSGPVRLKARFDISCSRLRLSDFNSSARVIFDMAVVCFLVSGSGSYSVAPSFLPSGSRVFRVEMSLGSTRCLDFDLMRSVRRSITL